MVDSPRSINDSATGFKGIFRAPAHTAAPSRDEGVKEDNFDRGESREGPPGSGSDVARRSCCFAESDDIVGSGTSGSYQLCSDFSISPDGISGTTCWLLTMLQTCLKLTEDGWTLQRA